jgi:hypothetical protein
MGSKTFSPLHFLQHPLDGVCEMQGGADVVVRESEKRMQRLGKEHKKKLSAWNEKKGRVLSSVRGYHLPFP